MRTAITLIYVVMAVYLLIASAARIAIQLSVGQDLDPLPFVGGAIGLLALVLLLPAYEEWRNHRPGVDRRASGRRDDDVLG